MKKSPDKEFLELLIQYIRRWPDAPSIGFGAFERPNVGIELLRRAMDRGRPLSKEEIEAVFHYNWKPGIFIW
jgi:hypothetical protein